MLGLGTWIKLGAALAVIAGLAWSHTAAYRAGRAVEQAAFSEQIRKENENAGNAAEDWRARYRLCIERGKLFDFETGTCND
ncbi:hypothetical protein [Chelativorans sp.]|uniref:hypothetical protein n=1 Tax=Chelativorans sp. TaxID=2203393 RepID=UPI0028120556|nr:hypothetical protein [Chelativorans sp.]